MNPEQETITRQNDFLKGDYLVLLSSSKWYRYDSVQGILYDWKSWLANHGHNDSHSKLLLFEMGMLIKEVTNIKELVQYCEE